MIYRERFICKEIYVFYYYYYYFLYRVVFSPLRDCFYKRRFSDQENIFFFSEKKERVGEYLEIKVYLCNEINICNILLRNT